MTNERTKEENQRHVLEKAMELCAEKGLEQMNLNQLAKESHLSVRSIYCYYDTKKLCRNNIPCTLRFRRKHDGTVFWTWVMPEQRV